MRASYGPSIALFYMGYGGHASMARTTAMPASCGMDGETIMLHPRRNRREKSRTLLILPVSVALQYGSASG